MQFIYRLLGFFINFIAIMLAVSLVVSLPALVSSPLTLLSGFMMIAIVLYSFMSYKFYRLVVQRKEQVRNSLRDWMRVNGIVSLVFCALIIIEVPFLIKNPQVYTDAINNFGGPVPEGSITGFFVVMMIYAAMLTIHILLTFRMMKRLREYFQPL